MPRVATLPPDELRAGVAFAAAISHFGRRTLVSALRAGPLTGSCEAITDELGAGAAATEVGAAPTLHRINSSGTIMAVPVWYTIPRNHSVANTIFDMEVDWATELESAEAQFKLLCETLAAKVHTHTHTCPRVWTGHAG